MPNKKSQQKSWFIPILRSKFATIELLRMLYKHQYEVVIFLRSLNRASSIFMDKFYEVDIKKYFQIYSIDIKVPLI